MTDETRNRPSTAAQALAASGDQQQAEDVEALEAATAGAAKKLATRRASLIKRLLFGPVPTLDELCAGSQAMQAAANPVIDETLAAALEVARANQSLDENGKISARLRQAVAKKGAYGFTVPTEYQGLGLNYSQLALLEEALASNGLGALAVEVSGQLTIGSSALLGYGDSQQRDHFLPAIAKGRLIAFALTEVGVGVNAKRVQAWVEHDEANQCWRLNAEGPCNKLYITSATHGGIAAIVARKGKAGKDIGLFIVELPEQDIDAHDHAFSCTGSNVSAFAENINSRLHFRNFPVPLNNEIQGNGVEVLFYCLRMGRCMLAAMSAGFQRMLAADAVHYARQRIGVGGEVLRHELPRLNILRMLGGALTAQALSHLSLAQDADGADLTGLRDLTKSAAARHLLESLIACERVLGGRSLDNDSRITRARPTVHAFGIVEGEDDLIRLGMVKELTAEFTDQYLQGLLAVLQSINLDADGQLLPEAKRIECLGAGSLLKHPLRTGRALVRLLKKPDFYQLMGWLAQNLGQDAIAKACRLIPTGLHSRYRGIPVRLARHIRFAEGGLRQCRWRYLWLNARYQLRLTRAQLPLQQLGLRIELLASMLIVSAHSVRLSPAEQAIAHGQCLLLQRKLQGGGPLGPLHSAISEVIADVEAGNCPLINTIKPQAFAHPWASTGQAPSNNNK